MSFSTQKKIYKAKEHVRKAVMYWPLVFVQDMDQYVEMLREEVVSGTDTIREGNNAGHNFHIPQLFLSAITQFGRGENKGRAVDPSMISWKYETVEESVWFDPRRQTPERRDALDNRWWLQMVPPCPCTFATMPIKPARFKSPPAPTTGKRKRNPALMTVVLSKREKRAAPSSTPVHTPGLLVVSAQTL
ncbi:hypothetical protein SERLA73DRAFT_68236 [Serpula lacrymans var. lacrymans S7.3]|uniref:Uncharacterized protein n=1 Tax=Serpula lacrymans var. lacrymans (strain S7.3) TaxID=936435 RepID=F8PHR7_SERL3|nr:hypothetical protein SERLA73DRAFT_68236 [Serpula lacrymans var. lacrymans S7.3]